MYSTFSSPPSPRMYLASSWVIPASKPVGCPPVVEAREKTWLATVPPRISWSLSLIAAAQALAATASSSATVRFGRVH
jgi:hypothetical protein